MPADGEGDAAQALASQQAAYCMSWACLPCLTIQRLYYCYFVPGRIKFQPRLTTTDTSHTRTQVPTPYRRPELLVLRLGSAI